MAFFVINSFRLYDLIYWWCFMTYIEEEGWIISILYFMCYCTDGRFVAMKEISLCNLLFLRRKVAKHADKLLVIQCTDIENKFETVNNPLIIQKFAGYILFLRNMYFSFPATEMFCYKQYFSLCVWNMQVFQLTIQSFKLNLCYSE